MIILLDLNYTLVENSDVKCRPFTQQIEAETYRQWLVELVKPHYVILMTARPAIHEQATRESIITKTGWLPQDAYFNCYNLAPPLAKERMLNEHVLPKYGANSDQFLAIESNPRTRGMYARYGIKAIKVEVDVFWNTLPT